jgi:uncharacterized protein YeeX (DUF496 family)
VYNFLLGREEKMDRKDLKIQALLEKITQLTTQYENQAADYRVEITMLTQERDEALARANASEQSTVSDTNETD